MVLVYIILAIVFLYVLNRLLKRKVIDLKDKKVLITGAASGIGRMLSEDMAKKGAVLILWDINESMLQSTVKDLKEIDPAVHVYSYVVDLSNRENVIEVAHKVKTDVGDIDVLVNNAGIVTGKSLFESSDVSIERVMAVNTNSHFWTIREFVPAMLKRNSGSVVAVSSMAGMVGTARLSDYCASKFAVLGLMESLTGQIYNEGKTGVHCTVICPYYISTGMFSGVNPGLLPLLTPRYVVDKMMHAIEYGESVVTCPPILGRVVNFARLILPYSWVIRCFKLLGVLDSMNTFTGRQKKQE